MIIALVCLAFLQAFHCAPTVDTNVQTECPLICPFIYFPICGSDGKTYGNECELNVDNCRFKTSVTKLYQGPCSKDHVTTTEAPETTTAPCRRGCPRIYRPLCGVDGRTYANDCLLNLYNCEYKTNVTVAHTGTCSGIPKEP